MDVEERFPLTWRYQPFVDDRGWVTEDVTAYIQRMQSGPLPNWPEEPLREWLHRYHGYDLENYADLNFERFRFSKEIWDTAQIPGREAFRIEKFCDSFQDIETRAAQNSYDWLAHFMLREGTWNTPVILLNNRPQLKSADGASLKTPYHLLEGHRRLSFLQGLKRLEKAKNKHEVLLVDIDF
jgi:hypothetical protein